MGLGSDSTEAALNAIEAFLPQAHGMTEAVSNLSPADREHMPQVPSNFGSAIAFGAPAPLCKGMIFWRWMMAAKWVVCGAHTRAQKGRGDAGLTHHIVTPGVLIIQLAYSWYPTTEAEKTHQWYVGKTPLFDLGMLTVAYGILLRFVWGFFFKLYWWKAVFRSVNHLFAHSHLSGFQGTSLRLLQLDGGRN